MRVPGQSASVLRVVLTVEEDRLVLIAGSERIGEWSLEEVTIALGEDGVHLEVEDEQLFLALADREGLVETVGIGTPKTARRSRRRRQTSHPQEGPPIPKEPAIRAPSRLGGRSLRWKTAGLVLAGLAVLGVIVPEVLALLLMVVGGSVLLVGVVVASDPSLDSRLPPVLSVSILLGAGLGAILLSVLVTVLT